MDAALVWHISYLSKTKWHLDFPGGPVVNASPSNAGHVGSFLDQAPKSHMPQGKKKKNRNQTEAIL